MADLNDSLTNELLDLAEAGDRSAQQELLVRHRARLRRMVVALLDPRLSARVDPSDVLQNAIASAAIQLPKYLEKKPIAFYPWIRGIVREELINVHRRHVKAKKRSVRRERFVNRIANETSVMELADRLISREPSPCSEIDRREQIDAVQSAMDQLDDSQRELLLMRFVERLTNREIAEVLGIPESTARLRVLRSIENITRLLPRD